MPENHITGPARATSVGRAKSEPVRPGQAIFWAVIAAIVLMWVGGGFDQIGWEWHTVQTDITADANWIVGETRECTSLPLTPADAKVMHVQPWSAVELIQCGSGPYHNISIRFWGRIARPDKQEVGWRCTRFADSFVCKATY